MAHSTSKNFKGWGKYLAMVAAICVGFLLISVTGPVYDSEAVDSEAKNTETNVGNSLSEVGKAFSVSEASAKKKGKKKKRRHPAPMVAQSPAPILAQSPAPSSPPSSGTDKPTCDESLQKLVDAASSGDVLEVPGRCVYRETVRVNKPLTLKATPGAEIRGSDVWTDWQQSGSYWVKGSLPSFSTHSDMSANGRCESGTNRCFWQEQVFFDGAPLTQVASNPQGGQFAVDGDRKVVLADDPSGHTVEVTTREAWLSAAAEGVTVEGFAMTHAANSGQDGALVNNQFDNMTVRNNNLSYAHGPNVNLGMATGLKLIGNEIHHGGQIGVLSYLGDLTVQNNKIYDNNFEGYDPWWAAGGMKATNMVQLVADTNEFYDNSGSGLWCDQACESATISNNRVHHNQSYGIHYEISQNAKIFGNTIWENGWGVPNSYGEPGILVSSSHDVDVYDNSLAWNRDGIIVVNADREGTAYDQVTNVKVHNNKILAKDYSDNEYHFTLSWVKDYSGGKIYEPTANNLGYDNLYYYDQPEGYKDRFKWQLGTYVNLRKLSDFNTTPGEEQGRYLSVAEKDQIVANSGVPASPEH